MRVDNSNNVLPKQNEDILNNYLEKALENLRNDELELAKSWIDKAINLAPNNATIYFISGNAFFKYYMKEEAIKYFDKAIKLNPNYSEAYYRIGDALSENLDYKKAIKYYDIAMQLNSDYQQVYNNIGIKIINEIPNTTFPINVLYAFENLANNNELDLVTIAGRLIKKISLNKEQFNNLLEIYERDMKAMNDIKANMFFNWGKKALNDENFENAIDNFRQAIFFNPNYIEANLFLAASYTKQKQYNKAIECYQKIQELEPNHKISIFSEGLAHFSNNDLDKALECYQKVLDLGFSDEAEVNYRMAQAYVQKDNFGKAILKFSIASLSGHKKAQEMLSHLKKINHELW